MITRSVPARAGLLGNPSDGYGGRTLSLAIPTFSASVQLHELDEDVDPHWPGGIVIDPAVEDRSIWTSVDDFVTRIDQFGYGTGPQLLAATVRTFIDVAESIDAPRPAGFRLVYESTIPRQVGLAGSSALVIAALGCLSEFIGLEIPEHILPSIALRVETEQLGITAGLQDRVVQTYGGLVAMDFGAMEVDGRFGVSYGHYEREDESGLPPLFLAYRAAAAESSEVYHSRVRARFESGEVLVRETMRSLAGLVTEGRAALRWHNGDRIAELIGANMKLRRRLGPLPEILLQLVDIALLNEAHATFTGSGGAVVGAYEDDDHFATLTAAYEAQGIFCIRLTRATPAE